MLPYVASGLLVVVCLLCVVCCVSLVADHAYRLLTVVGGVCCCLDAVC